MPRLLLAFLRRDFKIAASYRLSFVFTGVGAFVTLTVFYFLGIAFGRTTQVEALFGTDYFSFALLVLLAAAALLPLG